MGVYYTTKTVKKPSSNHCVYLHTNKINGKVYVGQTALVPEIRWDEGKGYPDNKRFTEDILKYGWNNFSHEILFSGLTIEESNRHEAEEIQRRDSMNPEKGYNRREGGFARQSYFYEKIKIPHRSMMSIEDVANELGCEGQTVKQWIEEGRLPYLKINKTIRIAPEDVDELKRGIEHD